MKKRILVCSAVISIFASVLSGCGQEKTSATITYNETIAIDEAVEEKLNLADYSLEYNFDTDAQTNFPWSCFAESDAGYYYWGDVGYLMFCDKTSGVSVPLCNRPDCEHNTSDCNAYFEVDYASDRYVVSMLMYYDGAVYIQGFDDQGYVNLYKVAADGSSREKCMSLFKVDTEDLEDFYRSLNICIHRGYVYYIDNDESMPALRRMKLGSSSTEVIFQTSGERPNLYRIQAYGDYVFFQGGNFTDDTYLEMNGGIWAYNTLTNEVKLVKDDAISSFSIVDNIIYYATETGVSAYSLETRQDTEIAESEAYPLMFADERYLYIYTVGGAGLTLSVYTREGEKVCTISDSNIYNFYNGNSEYLFGKWCITEENGSIETGVARLLIDDIAGGNAKWEFIGS